jgi:hypothetical protein
VSEILELARQEKFRVNLIEAYDQPWKRQLEGTVGGYWGLLSSETRQLKYPPGEPISNHPFWKLQMAGGIILCVLVYASAWLRLRRRPWSPRLSSWLAVGVSATVAGVLAGWAVEKVDIESFAFGGWLANIALLAASLAMPILASLAIMSGRSLPTFLELIGPRESRTDSRSMQWLGAALAVVIVLASETALGFVFDPRYRDFPFVELTIAAVPMLLLMLLNRPLTGVRPIAETTFACLLALSALYVVFNEGPANWQSLWTCGAYAVLAFTLSLARGGQSPKSSAQ